MNNRLIAIPAGALAAALAVGSMAYACTVVVGQTSISSPSGGSINVGTSRAITASASGLSGVPANTPFYMTFLNRVTDQDSMKICMSSVSALHPDLRMWDTAGGSTATAVNSTSSGTIPSSTRYIPSDVHPSPDIVNNHAAHNGTASVCHIDNGAYYGTNDQTITITGGSA